MLETTPGVGTAFVLRVPLTIAIVDAFTLRCGGQRFVVPVPVVEEIIELNPTRMVRGPRVGGRETRFFARRGETVAVVDLARALGLLRAAGTAERVDAVRRSSCVAATRSPSRSRSIASSASRRPSCGRSSTRWSP